MTQLVFGFSNATGELFSFTVSLSFVTR